MMWAITVALMVLALFIGGMADKLGSLVLELRKIRLAFEAQNRHYGIGTPGGEPAPAGYHEEADPSK